MNLSRRFLVIACSRDLLKMSCSFSDSLLKGRGCRLSRMMKAVMAQRVRFILSCFMGSGRHEWSEWSEEGEDEDGNVDVGG